MKKYLATILCLISLGGYAQSMTNITPVQMAQFQNLTPQQKQELLKLKNQQQSSNAKSNTAQATGSGARQMTDQKSQATTSEDDDSLPTETLVKDKTSEIFGRELFNTQNLTFAPSMSMATPPNYILSAGDELNVTVWGSVEETYALTVTPEGNINIPNVGLVNVAGVTVSAAEKRIKSRLVAVFSGLEDGTAHAKVTLGNIRSIKINIVGEAFRPGTYTLPSLATLFNALYAAGGVSDIGSLRNIKLYRNGEQKATLDVYDYLLKGKTEVDMRLEDGDMIVVAPYDNIVTITGNVKRPRKYELKRDENLATLIAYAGDFTGDAYTENVAVSRRSSGRQYSIHTVKKPDFTEFNLFDRDSIAVGKILSDYSNRITITGAVWREGDYELSAQTNSVAKLLEMAEGLTPDAFAGRGLIIRTKPDMSLAVIPFNAGEIVSKKAADIDLQKSDRVIITSINNMKEIQTISIKGEVNDPQTLPYADNITLEDVVVLGKGLKESASLARIEVARRIKNPKSTEATPQLAELFSFTIPEDLSLTDEISQFKLEPFDEVYVRRSPGYSEQRNVEIVGEVSFPGPYAIPSVTSRLTDLIAMSGGVNDQAYMKGASLERKLTDFDLKRIKSLRNLVAANNRASTDTINMDALTAGEYYPVGIDLVEAVNNPSSMANVVLKEGDRLIIPALNNTVKISGAVYYPNSTTYVPNKSKADYITSAGGYSDNARKKSFIIYMNGTVSAKANAKIEPGCEIVVPEKPRREPMNVQSWVGLSTSVVSMAAMISSLLLTR